jgi:hypothetical protein
MKTSDGKDELNLAEWQRAFTALLQDFFAHRAAVELIQGQHFDGHPILYPEWEAEWAEATRTIASALASANEHLERRADLRHAEADGGAGESNSAIALETIQARLVVNAPPPSRSNGCARPRMKRWKWTRRNGSDAGKNIE